MWGVAARTCSILLSTFLCNCRLASYPAILLASKWCIHTAVSTWPLPGRKKYKYIHTYIYIYIHKPDVMGKLSSKLRWNSILLNQTYIQKLHGNILKYCRLNLFKEITTRFNLGLQATSDLLQDFPMISFKLVNDVVILVFRSSLVLKSFFGLSLNRASHRLINVIATWGGSRPDVRADVTQMFTQPRLFSPAYVALRFVLFPGLVSLYSHPLDPVQHYFYCLLGTRK